MNASATLRRAAYPGRTPGMGVVVAATAEPPPVPAPVPKPSLEGRWATWREREPGILQGRQQRSTDEPRAT